MYKRISSICLKYYLTLEKSKISLEAQNADFYKAIELFLEYPLVLGHFYNVTHHIPNVKIHRRIRCAIYISFIHKKSAI